MFDLNDDATTTLTPARTDEGQMSVGETAALARTAKPNDLDGEKMRELQSRLLSYYRQELARQERNRAEMAVDEDYYDSIQWTQEEIEELRERGQAATVYNVIAQSINWIIGSEKRGRSDFKVLPRRKDGGKAAERKTALLKYLSDVNLLPFERSAAFEETVKAGLSWLETQIQDENDGEPITANSESWRNMIWDSTYRRLDMADCRYIFRVKWVDLDVAVALFPDRKEQLEQAAMNNYETWGADDIDGDDAMDSNEYERAMSGNIRNAMTYARKRVRLIEAWFRMPERVQKLRGARSEFRGDIFDPNDERHLLEVQNGRAVLAESPTMRMYCAIMTTKDMMCFAPSPYRHQRYPFTPIWGYRRARDGMPYGVIRYMRGMQDDVNKRLSKSLYILSTNKVIMDEGAVRDIEKFRQEVARPDAVIEKVQGKQIDINVDRELAPAHLDLASRSIQMMQQVGGVTDELLGRSTNAVSGVAVKARQEQGSLATNKLFDNLRLAFQQHGEKELSLIEQFMTDEKQFRITNMRGNPEYVNLNDGLPENDITRTKADFIIDEAEWRASMRQAAVAELTELIGQMPPDIGMTLLDLVVENMDIPNRDEIVNRIRAVNGQKDPDQDPENMSPAEQQREQAKAQMDQYNGMMADAQLREAQGKADEAQARAAEAQARVDLINAQANKANKDAEKTAASTEAIAGQAIRERVLAVKDATDTAQAVAFMPELATLADGILNEAGWNDANTPAGGDPGEIPYRPMTMVPNAVPNADMQPQQPALDGLGPNGAAPSQPMQ